MRTQLLMFIAAIGLVGSATLAAASTDATAVAPSATADSGQSATWTKRKLLRFSPPNVYVPANGYASNTHFISCDEIIDRVNFVLLQLGARAGDIVMDQRDCRRGGAMTKSIDATFSVLAPTDTVQRPARTPVAAHWQTVQLGGAAMGIGDCAFLQYVTYKVLPLFSTRNVKLISPTDCAKLGVGLRAEVLKVPQAQADSP
jgi:hypothetical protein